MSADFQCLPLSAELLKVLSDQNLSTMTPIQSASIPVLLEGRDLIGQSQTGSGKTLAFSLPILQNLKLDVRTPQALILCPTRELCDQVTRELRKFARALPGLQIVSLVGGQPHQPQRQALRQGVHLIVGTPGRTLDFLLDEPMDLSEFRTLVLDEADRMLDEGFANEMTRILEALPARRQTVFFSATFNESIEALSRKYQTKPERVTIQSEEAHALSIEQFIYTAENPEKTETLIRVLQQHPSQCTLVFCRTKASVTEITNLLSKLKVCVGALHGDLEQAERDQVMALFRNQSLRILVATDVAARGLDIDHLELVVNYDLPVSPEIYVHRIGRTGRAGRKGMAVSLANAFEAMKVAEIEKLTQVPMIRPNLGFKNQLGLSREFQMAPMKTILISGGKKDKIRAGDILGTLTAEPQALPAPEIGKIEIQDRAAYVAVRFHLAEKALDKLRRGKIKGSKFKCYFVETPLVPKASESKNS